MQNRAEMLLAAGGVAGRVGLDQVGKILLQIAQHRGGRVIRIGDEAEIDDVLGVFVAHQFGERRRVRGFVEKVPAKLGSGESCGCLVHTLFVAL